MASRSAHSWAMSKKVPNPPDCSTSRAICAAGHLRRPHHGEARGHEGVDQLVGIERGRSERQGGDTLEVVDPLRQAEGHVPTSLLLGLGDVHGARPGASCDDRRWSRTPRRALPSPASAQPSTSNPPADVAPIDSSESPKRPAARGPAGEICAATATSKRGWVNGRSCSRASRRVNHDVGTRHELRSVEQGQDRLERLLHHVALVHRVDPHHEGVRRQRTGTHAEHHAAPREVVEQHHPIGEDQRVVVGERAHTGPQPDVRVRCEATAMNTSGEAMIS